MGYNVTVCVGIAGICHDRNDCGGRLKGTESKLVALRFKKINHCVKIIYVQSHAEEAQIINLIMTHQIHMIAVGVYQNVVFHTLGIEVMSYLQVKALCQNLNAQFGVVPGKYGIARRYHNTFLLDDKIFERLFTDGKNENTRFFDIGIPHYSTSGVTNVLQIFAKMRFLKNFSFE